MNCSICLVNLECYVICDCSKGVGTISASGGTGRGGGGGGRVSIECPDYGNVTVLVHGSDSVSVHLPLKWFNLDNCCHRSIDISIS